MNPEQQRIAIAQACGWFFMDDSWHYPNGAKALSLPDYLTDLNAMHEAEKILDTITDENTIGSYAAYAQCLIWDGGYSATAAQRAEAFLRAINLWKL